MNNCHAECFPSVPTNGHFKTIFWVELHWFKELCPWRPQQQVWRVSSSSVTTKRPVNSRHLLSITLLTERALCHKRSEQWTCNASSLSVTNEWSFQDHRLSITVPTWRTPGKPQQWPYIVCLPSVITKWSAISKCLQRITVLTLKVIYPRRLEHW